jgi:hypothetical protein
MPGLNYSYLGKYNMPGSGRYPDVNVPGQNLTVALGIRRPEKWHFMMITTIWSLLLSAEGTEGST